MGHWTGMMWQRLREVFVRHIEFFIFWINLDSCIGLWDNKCGRGYEWSVPWFGPVSTCGYRSWADK